MLVLNKFSDSVSIINTTGNDVMKTINVGSSPRELFYDKDNGITFITNELSNTVSAVNASGCELVKNFPVGIHPKNLFLNPQNDLLYVANACSNTVSVIDATTLALVANISVGTDPSHFSFDQINGNLYVLNQLSDSLSVISFNPSQTVPYEVEFREAGLPMNVEWYVDLNGSLRSSNDNTITFVESNGSYSVIIPAINGYIIQHASKLVINGTWRTIVITYTPVSDLYILFGTVILVLLLAAVVFYRINRSSRYK